MADLTFHYPPELFNLLVDAIPRLNKNKPDLFNFFKGAGVELPLYQDLLNRYQTDPRSINKFEITRTVLERLNAKGEATLRERREILKRVVEFTNFDACWSNDQLEAKGLVASIREVVNQKDSFTRMAQEREKERQAKVSLIQAEQEILNKKRAAIEAAKTEFYGLFGASLTPQTRGKKLESALNNLFKAYGVQVREAFHLVGEQGEGIIEQIDGVIELKGALYFVEMKWYKEAIGKPEVSEHLVRLMSRAEARGLFISASDYTAPAIQVCKEFLQHKVIVLATLQEIVYLLEQQEDLESFLGHKVNAAITHKNPYHQPLLNTPGVSQ